MVEQVVNLNRKVVDGQNDQNMSSGIKVSETGGHRWRNSKQRASHVRKVEGEKRLHGNYCLPPNKT